MDKFEELYSVNVNENVEEKNGLTYLSWAWAWAEFKKRCPDATYEVERFNGAPYFYDESLGYMVFTKVTANEMTYEMWLPVMDGANKAMKKEPYTYTAKKFGKPVSCTCNAATMFDINKTIMRCLVKNLAMFGLGLYIYAGEDLPEQKIELLTPEHIAELNDLCGKTSVPDIATKVATRYKAKSLQDMEEKYFQKAKNDLLAQIELEEKAKANESKRNAE